ncbi:MAG: hypothetical protein V1913_17925 [Fibrobacterota bacterium]
MCPKDETKCCGKEVNGNLEERDNDTEIMHRSNLDLSAPPHQAAGTSCGCGNVPSKSRRIFWISLLALAAIVLVVAFLKR